MQVFKTADEHYSNQINVADLTKINVVGIEDGSLPKIQPMKSSKVKLNLKNMKMIDNFVTLTKK